MSKCVICGKERTWKFCYECKSQVIDYFADAIASSMEWMNIDVEKACELGYDIMEDFVEDEDLQKDVVNHLHWKEERRKHGEVTEDPVRTEGE